MSVPESAPGLALADLADGVLLLSALALLVWPRPSVARWVVLIAIGLVGLGGVAIGDGLWPRIAAAVAGLIAIGLAVALFRDPGEPAGETDPDLPARLWPAWTDPPPRPLSASMLPAALRASGFLALLLLCVAAVQTVTADALHARGALAIGLTVLLGGAAVAAEADRPGLVQVAGAIVALEALGWTGLRLVPPSAALAGLPAGLLLAALLAMRGLSAVLRDWLRDGAGPEAGAFVPSDAPPGDAR